MSTTPDPRHLPLKRRLVKWARVAGMAAGALGIAGYLISPWIIVVRSSSTSGVTIGAGAVIFVWTESAARAPVRSAQRPFFADLPPTTGWEFHPPTGDMWWFAPRLRDPADISQLSRVWHEPGVLVIPFWLLVATGAACAWPLLTPIAAPGRCVRCNFDLSGAPTEAVRRTRTRCPECGQVAEHDAEPA